MKIIATSDIHGDLPDPNDLPTGDVLVIAGDILPDDFQPEEGTIELSKYISSSRVMRQGWWFEHIFIPWLIDVKNIRPTGDGEWEKRYKSIIFTGGNHDFFLAAMLPSGIQKKLPKNVHYLSESAVEVEGVKFYGAGWNCTRGWAFAHDEEDHVRKLQRVPTGIDVMVVHGPPYVKEIEELDYHYLSPALAQWVVSNPLKAFICGHVHESYGSYMCGSTPVYVVSRKDRHYNDVHPFVEIEVNK